MLQAMVEEMTRFGKMPEQVLGYLNFRPEFAGKAYYKVHHTVKGKKITGSDLWTSSFHGNPVVKSTQVRLTSHRNSKTVNQDQNSENHDDSYDDFVQTLRNPNNEQGNGHGNVFAHNARFIKKKKSTTIPGTRRRVQWSRIWESSPE